MNGWRWVIRQDGPAYFTPVIVVTSFLPCVLIDGMEGNYFHPLPGWKHLYSALLMPSPLTANINSRIDFYFSEERVEIGTNR